MTSRCPQSGGWEPPDRMAEEWGRAGGQNLPSSVRWDSLSLLGEQKAGSAVEPVQRPRGASGQAPARGLRLALGQGRCPGLAESRCLLTGPLGPAPGTAVTGLGRSLARHCPRPQRIPARGRVEPPGPDRWPDSRDRLLSEREPSLSLSGTRGERHRGAFAFAGAACHPCAETRARTAPRDSVRPGPRAPRPVRRRLLGGGGPAAWGCGTGSARVRGTALAVTCPPVSRQWRCVIIFFFNLTAFCIHLAYAVLK